MPTCCVPKCTNYTGNLWGTRNLKYYAFPKDESLKDKWLQALNTGKTINFKMARICEKHFEENCFETISINKKSKRDIKIKRCLKANAIPTRDLNCPKKVKRIPSEQEDNDRPPFKLSYQVLNSKKSYKSHGQERTKNRNKRIRTEGLYLSDRELEEENARLDAECKYLTEQLQLTQVKNEMEFKSLVEDLSKYFMPSQIK